MVGQKLTQTAALALGLAVATTAAGCSAPDRDAVQEAPETSSEGVKDSYDLDAELRSVVADVESEYDVQAGVSVADRQGTFNAGLRGEEPAWSTVKVPIAIAALRDEASPELVDLAIRESDNDAAYALWSHVRWTEGEAGSAVKALLKEYDSSGEFEEPFGYSTWLLEEQAKFGAHLPCIPEAAQVYDAMDDIVEWQDNGLDRLPHTRAKGGWGLSEEDNGYTHRQIGVRETEGAGKDADGAVGLAIEVTMPGDYAEEAIPALNLLAAGVDRVVTEALGEGALKPLVGCASPSAEASASAASKRQGASAKATTNSPARRFGD
ncbi:MULTISPECIES: S-adenosylmethionine synthetase [Corynebacterium]|uniref:S-adenosylmethionine synthetase n=1 Tax=Corynebacterium TaxID=1716 RepID=UPI000B2C79C2|nr:MULTISPECIES: S-adenosylmethionine synthetase [Corynebacterium]